MSAPRSSRDRPPGGAVPFPSVDWPGRLRALPPRLGEALVDRGLVSRAQLEWALETQDRTGVRLGRVLLAAGLVKRQALFRVLAELWGCRFVDLLAHPPRAVLAHQFDPAVLAAEGWIPETLRGGRLVVATCGQPSPELERSVREQARGLRVDEVVFEATTDWDVYVALQRVFQVSLARDAAYGLSEASPEQAASSGLALWQALSLVVLALAAAAGAVVAPRTLIVWLIVVFNVGFVSAVLFKAAASVLGWLVARRRDELRERPRIPDADLPTYTVLVPVYREANVVGELVDHLRRLDYPPEKLEILLLMEEDDQETIDAARAAAPPDSVRFITIPDGEPKTKPRACNVGLFFARGEYLVIYDAEDRPEPMQLRDAVCAFREGAESLVCVQARLNYFNAHENLLTRMFTLEYSYWFDYMLPGLDRLHLPIPLGGTSNHFRTDRLRVLGGWDAFNVTEDADLGVRASARGYTVGIIDSTTYEEACSRYRPWIRQRTRWIKGYMQTAIVHTRHPFAFARHAGPRGVVGLLLLIAGTPLTFLVTPIVWALSIVWFVGVTTGERVPHVFPQPIDTISFVGFVVGNATLILLNALAVRRRRLYRLFPFALLSPVYWILHSIASWRAAHQLVVKPSLWEKTPHGLTSVRGALAPAPVPVARLAQPAHDGDESPLQRSEAS